MDVPAPDKDQVIADLARTVRVLAEAVTQGEGSIMAIGKDILAAVEEETTKVDSFIALVQGLINTNLITPAQGAQIIAEINANRDKLEAAIQANTPPGP